MSEVRTRSRRGGRAQRKEGRAARRERSWPTLKRSVPVVDYYSEEQIERIHFASLSILKDIGCEFRDPEALDMWRAAGADVRGERVHLDADLVMPLIDLAPEEFTLTARNPDLSTPIGRHHQNFAPTYGSPFVHDFNGERRYGTINDLNQFHKMAGMSPVLHNTGSVTVEPVDISVTKRHLHITASAIRHSEKPFMGPVTAPERAEDAVRIAEIVLGKKTVANGPTMISLCNCNSPLVWDETMLGAVKVYAKANQAVIIAPFVLAGANTPASTMAALAQLNAEALAGIAFAQLCRKGAPVVYGHFLATVSMRSGAPMAGTPEIAMLNYGVGQLARRYGVPFRGSGMIAGSKLVDAQSAYESMQTMNAVFMAGANYVLHAAGWNEAGLCASFAKFMLDCEQVEMLYRLGNGPQFGDFEEALEAIREVGPGGHYLGSSHTQKYFETAFYMPEIADNNSYEQWQIDGSKTAEQRGLEAARKLIESHDVPPLEESIEEELSAFIAKREEVIPDGFE